MKKKTVIVTRPDAWHRATSKTLDVTCARVSKTPRLRNGMLAGDTMGTVMDEWGRDNLIRLFEERRPDVFLFSTHFGQFGEALLGRLRKVSPKTAFVHWSGNQVPDENGVCWYVTKYRRYMDAVATNTYDPVRLAALKKVVGKSLTMYSFAFDPERFGPPEGHPTCDCFFGGGNTVHPGKADGRFPASRARYDLMTNVNKWHSLIIYGGGWPRRFTVRDGVLDVDYFRAMQSARIVLGTEHHDLRRYYTKRTIYAGASGRLLVTRYIPGMEIDFERGVNVEWFESVDEGVEMVGRYLREVDERERVAVAQREHFVKHHSWKARLRDFEKVVEKIL